MEERTTISVFVGSTRTGRIGRRVADWIARTLESRGHRVHIIDPEEHEVLLTLRIPNHYRPEPDEELAAISARLEESDGFVLVTNEYNHSFSGALKNAIDHFMPEYKRKPFLIASYSVGPYGGVRANEALRPVVSELKGVPAPLALLIGEVNTLIGEDGTISDEGFVERASGAFEDFEWYVTALKAARERE